MSAAPQLELAVPGATPAAPDVETPGVAPGGKQVPLTPIQFAAPPSPTVRRNEYLVAFPSSQGQKLTIRRIYLALPVVLIEDGLAVSESENTSQTKYGSTEEAEDALQGKGGRLYRSYAITEPTYSSPYEYTETTAEDPIRSGELVLLTEQVKRETSILPIPITVIASFLGSGGALWSSSFEIPMHRVSGEPGAAYGAGLIGEYADLNNPIEIRPDQEVEGFGFSLSAFVPTQANTRVIVGQGAEEAAADTPGSGLVTFFYDIENVPVGK